MEKMVDGRRTWRQLLHAVLFIVKQRDAVPKGGADSATPIIPSIAACMRRTDGWEEFFRRATCFASDVLNTVPSSMYYRRDVAVLHKLSGAAVAPQKRMDKCAQNFKRFQEMRVQRGAPRPDVLGEEHVAATLFAHRETYTPDAAYVEAARRISRETMVRTLQRCLQDTAAGEDAACPSGETSMDNGHAVDAMRAVVERTLANGGARA